MHTISLENKMANMKKPFTTGEQVQLKSGGPVMTVAGIHQNPLSPYDQTVGHVICQWFSGKKIETGKFPAESLQQPEEKKQ